MWPSNSRCRDILWSNVLSVFHPWKITSVCFLHASLGKLRGAPMYLRRIPLRMRIKQAAWKSSVGVRELLVWQRNCQHIKIARVLNKTETCTIYTCQREKQGESATLTWKISITTHTRHDVRCKSWSFVSGWISQSGRYNMFTWQGHFKCYFGGLWT